MVGGSWAHLFFSMGSRGRPTIASEEPSWITSSQLSHIPGTCYVPSLAPESPQPHMSTWRVPFPWALQGTVEDAEASPRILGLLAST